MGLDKRHSYYTVTQFAGLILAEKVDVPCDMKLTLFAGGGDQDREWAAHLNVLPIPLLAGVSAVPCDRRRSPCCQVCCIIIACNEARPHWCQRPRDTALQKLHCVAVTAMAGQCGARGLQLLRCRRVACAANTISWASWDDQFVHHLPAVRTYKPRCLVIESLTSANASCADPDAQGGTQAPQRHLCRRLPGHPGQGQSQDAGAQSVLLAP